MLSRSRSGCARPFFFSFQAFLFLPKSFWITKNVLVLIGFRQKLRASTQSASAALVCASVQGSKEITSLLHELERDQLLPWKSHFSMTPRTNDSQTRASNWTSLDCGQKPISHSRSPSARNCSGAGLLRKPAQTLHRTSHQQTGASAGGADRKLQAQLIKSEQKMRVQQ